MAIKIRLARGGSKKRPFYRIVAADSRMPRDGRFIEKIGTYNPLLSKDNDSRVVIDTERVKYWLSKGAQVTDRISRMLEKLEILEVKIRSNPKKGLAGKAAEERKKEKQEKTNLTENDKPSGTDLPELEKTDQDKHPESKQDNVPDDQSVEKNQDGEDKAEPEKTDQDKHPESKQDNVPDDKIVEKNQDKENKAELEKTSDQKTLETKKDAAPAIEDKKGAETKKSASKSKVKEPSDKGKSSQKSGSKN